MTKYAALDVSMEQTAVCVVDEKGRKLAEGKVPTDPDAITDWLAGKVGEIEKIGMETGPLAVWLWNDLTRRGLPIVCLDARHANAALSMMPNKTDRHEAANVILTRQVGFSSLKAWGLRIAKDAGFKKAKVAVARKLAVILHAMWKTNEPFRYAAAAA